MSIACGSYHTHRYAWTGVSCICNAQTGWVCMAYYCSRPTDSTSLWCIM